MATATRRLRPGAPLRLRALRTEHPRVATVAGLALLVLVSAVVRVQRIDVGFWIDEALSVGIADRPLGEIPGTLRLDGSPPLYYVVLHFWMQAAGRSEVATHLLSLLLALAVVPVSWMLVRRLFDERTAWIAAALAALNPFLTNYAQETRMYSLVVLLGTVAVCSWIGSLALRRGRAWTAAFSVSLAALLYTHNWGVFFGAATGAAWLVLLARERGPERRALLREGVLAYGGVLLLYAPWLPTVAFQAAHTGAPWARTPGFVQLVGVPEALLREAPAAALAVAGGVGLVAVLRGRTPLSGGHRRGVAALVGMALGTVILAWVASQASPAWATRYLAAAVPPLLLLAAVSLRWGGRASIPALVVALGVWVGHTGPSAKSNVQDVAEDIAPSLRAGDLVVSTQPEQLPALAYYLHEEPRLRWATLWGRQADVGVTDWRDGVKRLRATSAERHLEPLLDRVPLGGRVALVVPEIASIRRWDAPWTRLVRLRSDEWAAHLQQDRRFRVVAVRPMTSERTGPNPVRATLYLRVAVR